MTNKQFLENNKLTYTKQNFLPNTKEKLTPQTNNNLNIITNKHKYTLQQNKQQNKTAAETKVATGNPPTLPQKEKGKKEMGQKENGYILDVLRPKQTSALPSKHLRPRDDVEIIAIDIHDDVEHLIENPNANPDKPNESFPLVNM